MQKAKRGRAKTYDTDSLMWRSVIGILLIALGVITIIAVVGGIEGAMFAPIKDAAQGLAGGLCLGIPLFLIWGGILVAFSARQKAPVRAFAFLSLLYISVLGIINLLSAIKTTPYLDAAVSYNQSSVPPVISPSGYWEVIKAGYYLSNHYNAAGGALGMITAWPLWRFVGTVGGVTVLAVVCLICVLFFSKFDLLGSIRHFKEKSEERIEQEEIERQKQEYMKQMQKEQMRSKPKRGEAAAAMPFEMPVPQQMMQPQMNMNAGFPDMQNVFAQAGAADAAAIQTSMFMPASKPNQPALYDEMIVPEVPDGTQPSGFKLKNLFARRNIEVQKPEIPREQPSLPMTEMSINPAMQRDRDVNRVVERMEENRRRKEEIDRQLTLNPADDVLKPTMSPEVERAIQAARVVANGGKPPKQNPKPAETANPYANAMHNAMQGTPSMPAAMQAPVQNSPVAAMTAEQIAYANQSAAYQPPNRLEEARLEAAQAELQQKAKADDRFGAYKRPAADTTAPTSGTRIDTPNLKIPPQQSQRPAQERPPKPYPYPMIELLNLQTRITPDTTEQDRANALRLEKTLESFGIPARVQRVTHGPAVTRFELGLVSSGINVKRIMNIADNIALDMAANGGVRIEVPIPGTNLFGVEVPNKEILSVSLAEVLTSPEMTGAKSSLSVALGKDIAGKAVICDLAKMPHLLIAGQTGSGKSVCINSIINSLLYRSTPDEVRMIMIDPKVVELQGYNKVPHLLIPVVSDPHKASGALAWAVQEMLDRYHKMQSKGVREITNYNAKLAPGEPKLPRIVIIIDELADLMLACKKEVEESIIRLAQLARAAGIHVIVATQRPTVNVITGLIKANIPSRIAFAVASSIDSRTILDMNGAEKLLGKGDMFYYPTGEKAPLRVQGCFVSDSEITNIVDYIGANSDTDYDESINAIMDSSDAEAPDNAGDGENDGDADERLQEAVEMVLSDGQASISMLQRRMKIGYARAGRLIDDMAARGIISKSAGSKPRELLMTYEQYLQQKDTLLR